MENLVNLDKTEVVKVNVNNFCKLDEAGLIDLKKDVEYLLSMISYRRIELPLENLFKEKMKK